MKEQKAGVRKDQGGSVASALGRREFAQGALCAAAAVAAPRLWAAGAGGKGDDLVPFFNKDGLGAIVNSSRGIIAAYTKAPYSEKYGTDGFADAARAAVKDMKKDIAQALEKV